KRASASGSSRVLAIVAWVFWLQRKLERALRRGDAHLDHLLPRSRDLAGEHVDHGAAALAALAGPADAAAAPEARLQAGRFGGVEQALSGFRRECSFAGAKRYGVFGRLRFDRRGTAAETLALQLSRTAGVV